LNADDVATFSRCISVGGVAVFPADTVYGLACDPDSREAVDRLYALKGRPPSKPAAVMFFDRELALASLAELPVRTRTAVERLLPGGVTLLVPNLTGRFPLACSGDPATLGLRMPALDGPLAPLSAVRWPVLQSSANLAGAPAPRRLDGVPEAIRAGADLLLDAGELPGTASTVVDLRRYADTGEWAVVREGAVDAGRVAEALSSPGP
jgi:L-threonylcarbamoyladenylate synthase